MTGILAAILLLDFRSTTARFRFRHDVTPKHVRSVKRLPRLTIIGIYRFLTFRTTLQWSHGVLYVRIVSCVGSEVFI